MNKSFNIILLHVVLFFLIINNITGQNVKYNAAFKVAENFLNHQNHNKKQDTKLSQVYLEGKDTLMYVFNQSKGFIIISGDYSVLPILAYSDEENFNKDDLNPSAQYWLNGYCEQIKNIKKNKNNCAPNSLWNKYLNEDIIKSDNEKKSGVSPMITSKWGQGKDYNYYCPAHPNSPYEEKCVTGCVATAMGMIMRYHQFPTQGKSSNSYYHPHFGNISVDFSKEKYEWGQMNDVINSNSKDAIARLLYDCGVSVNMDYTPKLSSANTSNATVAFFKYFNYRYTISLEDRSDNKYELDYKWKSILTDNLIEGHPIIYSGFDATYGGHAWVLDGFKDTTYFHFNWGWEGNGNGYFALDKLTPNSYDFTAGQSAIVNIIPSTASYCMEKRIYTDSTRTIEDGSHYLDYWNNTKCDWLIKPDYSKKIILNFSRFSTEKDKDVVNIYDGENSSAPLIGAFSGNEIPPTIIAESGKMFITFSSDSQNQGFGWSATYNTVHKTIEPILIYPSNDSTNAPAEVLLKWKPIVTEKYNYKIQFDTIEPSNNIHFIKVSNKKSLTLRNLKFGKTYYWRVKTLTSDNIDSSAWSNIYKFTVINTVFQTTPVNNALSVSLPAIIKWKEIAGVNHYRYEIDITPNFNSPEIFKKTIFPPKPNTSPKSGDTLTNLINGGTYFWRIKAIDSISQTLWSDVRKISIIRSLSDAPLLISPSDSANNLAPKFTLQWGPIQNCYNYFLEYINISNPEKVYAYNMTANKYPVEKLIFGQSYKWRVKANGKTNTSSWSDYNLFTITKYPELKTPLNNSLNQITKNLKFRWDSLAGVLKYEIQIDTTDKFNSQLFYDNSISTSSASISTLLNLTKYYWRVRAIHSLDTSKWSAVYCFTTIDSHLAPPELLSPANNSINQLQTNVLKWGRVIGATSYKLQLDTTLMFSHPKVITTNQFTYTTLQLLYNKQYFWRVKALKNDDSSQYSSHKSFYTVSYMSEKPRLFKPANEAIYQMPELVLEWSQMMDAEKYIIQIDTNIDFSNHIEESNVSAQLHLNNLKFGLKYYWKVKAIQGTKETDWSNVNSFNVISYPNTLSPNDNSFNHSIINTLLTWNKITGIKSYQLNIDTTNTFSSPNELNFSLIDTNKALNSLIFSSKYFWRVRAITDNDTSAWSPEKRFYTSKTVVILKPASKTFNNMPILDIVLKPLDGASEYDYRIDTTLVFNSSVYKSDSTYGLTEFRIKNLMFSTKYYIQLRGRNNYTTSQWSNPITFSIRNSFIQLVPDDNAKNQMLDIQLGWENITGVIQYMYEIDNNDQFNSYNVIRTTSLNNIVNNNNLLKFGTKYFWRVQTQSSLNNPPLCTNTRSFWTTDTVIALSPANNFSLGNNSQITFTWKTLTGIKNYELQYDTSQTFSSPVINMILPPIGKTTLKGFKPKTNYFWRIRAISNYPDTTKWSDVRMINDVKTLTNINMFSIYPNPANNNIILSFSQNIKEDINISIFNITGQTELKEQKVLDNNGKCNINISMLKSGIFFIAIETKRGITYKKLIKQ